MFRPHAFHLTKGEGAAVPAIQTQTLQLTWPQVYTLRLADSFDILNILDTQLSSYLLL